MNKKRIATSVAAVATAAALLLGGTFAWQSVNQTALNEASDVINPGGRLHDDFYIDADGNYNSDIYVENFAEDTIYARVKLQEYMEIIVNQDVEGAEVVETVTGSKSLNDTPAAEEPTDNTSGYTYEYVTHYFDQENSTDKYWNWTMGAADSAEVWYIPTFNMNKDSLVADRNGMYVDRIGGISNRGQDQYEEWTTWAAGNFEEGTEIYDVDSNMADEVGFDFENLQTYVDAENIAIVENAAHYAVAVGYTNGLISMSEWLALGEDEDKGSYWVYDTDGWVYWSSPIEEDETTGLLLDAIELDDVMDDTWYYAINAVGQFITADDLGKVDNTGFYADGETVSDDALTLLESIGVDVSGEAAGDEGEGEEPEEPEDPYGFHHMLLSMNNEKSSTETFFDEGYLTPRDTIQFGVAAYYNNGETIEINSSNARWDLVAVEGSLADGTTISEDGKLTVAEDQDPCSVIKVQVTFTDKDGADHTKEMSVLVSDEDITLELTVKEQEPYYTDTAYEVTPVAYYQSNPVESMVWHFDVVCGDEGHYEMIEDPYGNEHETHTAANCTADAGCNSETGAFTAYAVGQYQIRAWAQYLPGRYAETTVTVVAE